MNIEKISIGKNPPHQVNVIIEVPMNADPVKYETDKDSGAIFVDRFIGTAMYYPCNYGFIPHTLSEDGDPADVLVVSDFPIIYYPWGLHSAAIRFKNSLQENAKIHVFSEDIIESSHNGIVAWEKRKIKL